MLVVHAQSVATTSGHGYRRRSQHTYLISHLVPVRFHRDQVYNIGEDCDAPYLYSYFETIPPVKLFLWGKFVCSW
jgi:hypothetical protein